MAPNEPTQLETVPSPQPKPPTKTNPWDNSVQRLTGIEQANDIILLFDLHVLVFPPNTLLRSKGQFIIRMSGFQYSRDCSESKASSFISQMQRT